MTEGLKLVLANLILNSSIHLRITDCSNHNCCGKIQDLKRTARMDHEIALLDLVFY